MPVEEFPVVACLVRFRVAEVIICSTLGQLTEFKISFLCTPSPFLFHLLVNIRADLTCAACMMFLLCSLVAPQMAAPYWMVLVMIAFPT